MRKTIITGLTTVMAVAAVAGPAYAQAPVPSSPSVPSPPAQIPAVPATPAVPAAPSAVPSQPDAPGTLHIRNFTVRKSRGGYVYAAASIVGTNLATQGVNVTYRSSLKTYNPHTLGPWRHTSGSVGIGGGDTILALKFGYKGKTVAQVRKSLKITIANATNGAVITSGTSVASASGSTPAFSGS